MKKILTILMLFIATAAFSQDPWWQKDSDTFEAQADKLTEQYSAELALRSKQEILFQKKIEEFLIRYDQIEQNYTGKEKLDMLYGMRKNETAEMRDILTNPQFQLYVELKQKLQPLATVEK